LAIFAFAVGFNTQLVSTDAKTVLIHCARHAVVEEGPGDGLGAEWLEATMILFGKRDLMQLRPTLGRGQAPGSCPLIKPTPNITNHHRQHILHHRHENGAILVQTRNARNI
jgi:hypothetical protein